MTGDDLERCRLVCAACMRAEAYSDLIQCLDCWLAMPVELRVAYIGGYRHRQAEPQRRQESLAAVLGWCRDRRAVA